MVSSPGDARGFVGAWCRRHGVSDPEYDITLLVNEIVTHAMRHHPHPIAVHLEHSGRAGTLVNVEWSAEPRQRVGSNASLSLVCRRLLASIAEGWGIHRGAREDGLWFTVPDPPGRHRRGPGSLSR